MISMKVVLKNYQLIAQFIHLSVVTFLISVTTFAMDYIILQLYISPAATDFTFYDFLFPLAMLEITILFAYLIITYWLNFFRLVLAYSLSDDTLYIETPLSHLKENPIIALPLNEITKITVTNDNRLFVKTDARPYLFLSIPEQSFIENLKTKVSNEKVKIQLPIKSSSFATLIETLLFNGYYYFKYRGNTELYMDNYMQNFLLSFTILLPLNIFVFSKLKKHVWNR